MPAVSLEQLQQQISQRELELQALRRELETRQSELASLASRKEQLLGQLCQVDAEIAALAASSSPQAAVPPKHAAAVPPSSPPRAGGQPRLADLIVTLLRQAGGPMTSRQLREEALRGGYQTSSRNLVKTIEIRIHDLKKQGIVQRASGQPGYLLTPSAKGTKSGTAQKTRQPTPGRTRKATAQAAGPAKPVSTAKKASRAGGATSAVARATGPVRRGSQPPLRDVLTDLLQKSGKPLSGAELAKRALAAGCRTNSKRFVGVVWAMLAEMDNIEHVPDKGYRMKKTKSKS